MLVVPGLAGCGPGAEPEWELLEGMDYGDLELSMTPEPFTADALESDAVISVVNTVSLQPQSGRGDGGQPRQREPGGSRQQPDHLGVQLHPGLRGALCAVLGPTAGGIFIEGARVN